MVTTELRPLTPPEPKPVHWLLPDLLPRGELIVLEGPAGVGKSLLAAAFAAHASRAGQGTCTLLTASEASSLVLGTHLTRQQPDYDHLRELVWTAIPPERKKDAAVEPALFHLEDHLQNHKPALLVIDSLEESLSVLSGEPERRLKWFWSTLVMLARRYKSTILVLTRPQGRRGAARVARTAAEAAKAVFTLSWHPADASLRVLTRTRDLLAPAGTQWHLAIDPDGHADWHRPDATHHVAPGSGPAPVTWLRRGDKKDQLPALIRLLEDTLTAPTPAATLRDTVLQKGFSLHAFYQAMREVDATHEKHGPTWTYVPGPELLARHELRLNQSERPQQQVDSLTTDHRPLTTRTVARPQPQDDTTNPHYDSALAKVDAMLARFNAEVGDPSAATRALTDPTSPARARYDELNQELLHSLTPHERRALLDYHSHAAPCCVRAQPIDG